MVGLFLLITPLNLGYTIPFKCHICGQPFKFRKSLQIHRDKSHPERQHPLINVPTTSPKSSGPPSKLYKCSTCDKKFQRPEQLYGHYQRRHNARRLPFECDKCKKKSTDIKNITLHMRDHTKDEFYRCPYCEKKTKTKRDWETHIDNVHLSVF